MRTAILSFLLCGSTLMSAFAQTSAPASSTYWDHLKAVPAGTRMHVNSDKMNRTCVLNAVTDEELTCSKGRVVNTAHYTFPRAEISSVKLTRYTISTVGGLGIGVGVGAAISAATIPSGGFLDFKGAAVAIIAVGSGILGAAALGPTDAFRGPTVYRRLKP